MSILERLLAQKDYILADGATGTNYFNLGLETGHPPELWVLEQADLVAGLHRAFIEAGSDMILTNSFGGNFHRLKLHGAEGQVAELNTAAARIARTEAQRQFELDGREVVVAGSMGPTGELFAPLGTLTHATAVEAFSAQAMALAEGGVDLLWIETISSFEEIFAAIEAAQKTGLPVGATMTFDTAGKSMMGVAPADFAAEVGARGVVAVGANCGIGPAELMHAVMAMQPQAGVVRVAKGNCGIPQYVDGAIHYHGTPELMADYAVLARDAGVAIIGGCCGTTPEHIRAMREALDGTPVGKPVDAARLEKVLGKAWAGLDAAGDAPESPKRGRGRRRRRG